MDPNLEKLIDACCEELKLSLVWPSDAAAMAAAKERVDQMIAQVKAAFTGQAAELALARKETQTLTETLAARDSEAAKTSPERRARRKAERLARKAELEAELKALRQSIAEEDAPA